MSQQFFLYRKVAGVGKVVLTATGKKEHESSSSKKHLVLLGECDEQGNLINKVAPKTEMTENLNLSKAENDDAKKSVEEILNTPVDKNSDIAKATTEQKIEFTENEEEEEDDDQPFSYQ